VLGPHGLSHEVRTFSRKGDAQLHGREHVPHARRAVAREVLAVALGAALELHGPRERKL
jgi:hypothetical protein